MIWLQRELIRILKNLEIATSNSGHNFMVSVFKSQYKLQHNQNSELSFPINGNFNNYSQQHFKRVKNAQTELTLKKILKHVTPPSQNGTQFVGRGVKQEMQKLRRQITLRPSCS